MREGKKEVDIVLATVEDAKVVPYSKEIDKY